MSDPEFVYAWPVAGGVKQRIPVHWLADPVIGPKWTQEPPDGEPELPPENDIITRDELAAAILDKPSVKAAILTGLSEGLDGTVADLVELPDGEARGKLLATFAPLWRANTAYTSGQIVQAPNGAIVAAKTGFTSGSTYNAANWDPAPGLAAYFARRSDVGTISQRAARAANPKRPVSMATPPTVTANTAQAAGTSLTTGSAITSPVALLYTGNTSKFFLAGGPASAASFNAVRNNLLLATDGIESLWPIEWITDAPDFEFAIRHTNGGTANHRLMVDGEWANTAVLGNGSGQQISYRVQTSGNRRTRRYILWVDRLAFVGLVITSKDSVVAPLAAAKVTRAMFFGDSYVAGDGADQYSSGLAAQAVQMLGFDDPYFNGKSGTGYVRAVSGRKFIDRIADTITPYAPDLLIVMGGYNDNTANIPGLTAGDLQTAAAAFYAALRTAMPNMPVIVFGKQTSATPSAEAISFNNAIKTAALAAPNVVRFVDMVTTPWITGTGKVGATTGNGNADVLISSDGAHPSQAGHDYYADRAVDEIRAYLMEAAA